MLYAPPDTLGRSSSSAQVRYAWFRVRWTRLGVNWCAEYFDTFSSTELAVIRTVYLSNFPHTGCCSSPDMARTPLKPIDVYYRELLLHVWGYRASLAPWLHVGADTQFEMSSTHSQRSSIIAMLDDFDVPDWSLSFSFRTPLQNA